VPLEHVFAFLRDRRGKLDGVVVTGGEPTIQPRLAPFLRQVKALGYHVKLDTNGGRPEVVAALLEEGLIDYLAMDIKAPLACYERLAGRRVPRDTLEESIALVARSGVEHEFRTTVVEALLSAEDVRRIRAIVPSGSPHRLQPFQPQHALDPALRSPVPAREKARARVPAGAA